MTTVRHRLRGIREGCRVSSAEMARHIGVNVNTLTAWISGSKRPSVASAQRVARAYGIRVEWLLFGDGEMCEVTSDD